jgi:O-antigen ligase
MRTLTATDTRARHAGGILAAVTAGGAGLAAVAWLASQDFGPVVLLLAAGAFVPLLIVARPEFGVLALLSTFFLSYPEALAGSGQLTINNVLGLALAGILLVHVALGRRVDFLRYGGLWLAALVTAVFVTSSLVGGAEPPFPHLRKIDLTDQRVHDIVTKFGFLVFLLAFIRARWHLVLVAAAVVLFVGLTAPSAVMHALTAEAANAEHIRASADFGIVAARNANRLAFLCAIGVALVGYGMTMISSWAIRALGAALIGLFALTVFLSGSRSGLINLVILGLFFLARAGLKRRTRLAVSLGLALVMLGVVAIAPAWVGLGPDAEVVSLSRHQAPSMQVYLQRITTFFAEGDQGSGVAGSTRARSELLALGLGMVADQPLTGVGVGNFRWTSVVDYGNPYMSALHNSYVLTLVEGGLLLFVPYVLLFGWTWRELAATRRLSAAGRQAPLRWLVDATRAIFVIFLVFSFFADLWHDVYLYLIVGLSSVLARLHAEEEPEP